MPFMQNNPQNCTLWKKIFQIEVDKFWTEEKFSFHLLYNILKCFNSLELFINNNKKL